MAKRQQERLTDQCIEVVPAHGYRGPLWYEARRAGVTASEIPAVLDLSPYQSRFDLWWEKRLLQNGSVPENRAMSRGRRVEPLVIEDFLTAHPEFAVRHVGLVQSVDRPWQLATPDGLVYEATGHAQVDLAGGHAFWDGDPVAVVEAKTAGSSEGWGEQGTDEVPVHYRAQVLWQMDVLGLDTAYLAVWVGYDHREYVVERDENDLAFMREQAQAFLADIANDVKPLPDAHQATTRRLKALHPTVQPGEVEVDPAVWRQYLAARRLKNAAEDRMALAENRLRHTLGDHAVGTVNGAKAVSRSVFDVAERVQTMKAHTQNRLYVSERLKPPRRTKIKPPVTEAGSTKGDSGA